MNANYKILLVIGLLIGGVILYSQFGRGSAPVSGQVDTGSNVAIVDGTQIVTITAKGGYQPASTQLTAGLPTTLRFATNGTYDCSSAIRIPALGISQALPASGNTDIVLGSLTPGTIQGTCSMGMYKFALEVRS